MPPEIVRPWNRVLNSLCGSLSALTGALLPVHESVANPVPSRPQARDAEHGERQRRLALCHEAVVEGLADELID